MKKLFLLIITSLVFISAPTFAQDSHTSNTNRKWWYPDHMVVQFAGNIGLVSAGPGYSFLNDKMNADFMYGIVPSFESNTSIHLLTAKLSYNPINIKLSENYMFEPLKIGSGISYSIGRQFYTTWPKQYPDSYYWWASSLRLTPFIGSTISRKIRNENTAIKRLELYGEVGTTDLDIVSKLDNKSLSYGDILNIAIGTKLVF
jgi:hypothetical protein